MGNVSPSKTEKTVVEIWCYLPEICTLGAEQKSSKNFVKTYEKVKFL